MAPTTANDSASAIVEPVQSDKQVKITVLSTPAVQQSAVAQPEAATQEAATTQEVATTGDAVKSVQLVDQPTPAATDKAAAGSAANEVSDEAPIAKGNQAAASAQAQ